MDAAASGVPMGVLLMSILIGAAALFVLAWSFVVTRPEPWEVEGGFGALGRVRKRYERLLRAIKDVEYEHEAGILTHDDFQATRLEIKRRAVEARKDLERARRARLKQLARTRKGIAPSQRNRLEDLVRARAAQRATKDGGAPALPGASGEAP